MSQVTEQSVRFQTALASIKLIQASAVLDLPEDDFDFLTSNKVWIATDRSRARRCVDVLITLLNVTLIILTLSVSRLLNLLLRLVAFLLFLNPQCLASISRWITASSSW